MKLGGIVNTATRRQRSADAVGFLGMLGKFTDGLRKTGLVAECLTEAWTDLRLAERQRCRHYLSVERSIMSRGQDEIVTALSGKYPRAGLRVIIDDTLDARPHKGISKRKIT